MLELYDIYGKKVKNIGFNGYLSEGIHVLRVAADDLVAGIYFLRVRTNERVFNIKLEKI